MMDKCFKVSLCFLSLIATLSTLKKKESCYFITKHLTDFAMLCVSSLVLTLSQTTNFRLFQTERLCRRQF